jgi:hypothetical protein
LLLTTGAFPTSHDIDRSAVYSDIVSGVVVGPKFVEYVGEISCLGEEISHRCDNVGLGIIETYAADTIAALDVPSVALDVGVPADMALNARAGDSGEDDGEESRYASEHCCDGKRAGGLLVIVSVAAGVGLGEKPKELNCLNTHSQEGLLLCRCGAVAPELIPNKMVLERGTICHLREHPV